MKHATVYSGKINMVLNVHRNHKAYQGQGESGEGGMDVGKDGHFIYIYIYIYLATLSPKDDPKPLGKGSLIALNTL